ncbi:MAG TPA: helix-turn-helix transcriptional regulator [Anaerolineales bacterium]|nr:helix-turn-helix transcriptional regulator [Anaerolineales bacterium]
MDTRSQTILRTKKLGVLIRDARLSSRRDVDECAKAIGVTKGVFRAYEEGRRAPSLPELEILVYNLKLPINHFWGQASISDDASPTEPLDLPRLVEVRQRMIGALLRQQRDSASLSIKSLVQETGIPGSRIKSYELGERPIPLPELEVLATALGSRVETFFDESGPIGRWMSDQKGIQLFLELPKELQDFVCQPVNRPYLELALKLSSMPTDKLRSVAEGLLDITL